MSVRAWDCGEDNVRLADNPLRLLLSIWRYNGNEPSVGTLSGTPLNHYLGLARSPGRSGQPCPELGFGRCLPYMLRIHKMGIWVSSLDFSAVPSS